MISTGFNIMEWIIASLRNHQGSAAQTLGVWVRDQQSHSNLFKLFNPRRQTIWGRNNIMFVYAQMKRINLIYNLDFMFRILALISASDNVTFTKLTADFWEHMKYLIMRWEKLKLSTNPSSGVNTVLCNNLLLSIIHHPSTHPSIPHPSIA